MSDEREALIERGARAYYEWACCGTEGSRWDDEGPHQEGARRFARERSAVFLDAFLGDRAALLAALGYEQVGWVRGENRSWWSGVEDYPATGWDDWRSVWASRVSEERLMSDDRQALVASVARTLAAFESLEDWDAIGYWHQDRLKAEADHVLDALLADPVPLLREIAAATKPCEVCDKGKFAIRGTYGVTHWHTCATCHGSGRVPAVDRAALLAALGMEQVGWGARMKQYDDDDGTTGWFLDQTRTKLLAEYVPVWAARVSEETP